MGTHRNSHSAKLNRTLAFGAVAGATAIGLGALAAMTAPAAQADWFGGASRLGSGNASGNDLLEGTVTVTATTTTTTTTSSWAECTATAT